MQELHNSLHGYLRIVFRRKWLIILPAFGGLILGICASVLLPKEYRSSTTILVQEGKSDNPLFNNITMSSTMTQRAQAIRETILGWESLVKLVKRLNLDQRVKTNYDFERLIAKLRKDIQIVLRDNDIIDLAYVSEDPQKAQAVVKNVTDIFIERNVNVQNKETTDAIKFIEQQLRVYRGKIKSTEIVELRDKLNALLVDSTEEHPLVKQLRERIRKKMEELKKDNLEFSEDATLNAQTTNPMIMEIKKTLSAIGDKMVDPQTAAQDAKTADKDLYKVMLIDKLDNVMARDVSVNDGIYTNLLQRLETAKITQRLQSSKEGTKYTILDPPRLPLRPIKPNKVLVVLITLFLGLAVGGAGVFMAEFLDKSFLDVQEASRFVGEPLLGAISKISTQESIDEVQSRTKWILTVMAVSGIIIIALAILISAFVKP